MSFATGFGEHIEGFVAGRQAVQMVTDQIGQPDLLLCFSSVHVDQVQVLQGIRSVLPDVAMVGGSSGATITEHGWRKRAVALMGIKGDRLQVLAANAYGADQDARRAGQSVAEELHAKLGRMPKMLLVFPHAVFGCSHPEFLAGIRHVWPDVLVVGGASAPDGMIGPGDPMFLKNFQVWNGEVLAYSTPVVALDWDSADVADAFAWGHGYQPLGMSGRITKSQANVLYEVDDRPALAFFEKYLGEGYDFRVDASVTMMGLVERYADDLSVVLAVSPLGVQEDGSIAYACPVAEGSETHMVRTTRDSLLRAAKEAAVTLRERLGERMPSALFMFSCGGRHAILGDDVRLELEAVQAVFGRDVPVIGLQAGGEFVPLVGQRGQPVDRSDAYGCSVNNALCLYAVAE